MSYSAQEYRIARTTGRLAPNPAVPWSWSACLLASLGSMRLGARELADSSRLGNHATEVTGDATKLPARSWSRELGRFAWTFDGSNDGLETPIVAWDDIGGGNEFTMAAWIKTNAAGAGNDVVLGSHETDRFYLAINYGANPPRLFWGLGNTTSNSSGYATLAADGTKWEAVAVIRRGSQIETWVDGVLVSDVAYTGNDDYATQRFHVGTGYQASAQSLPFNGQLTDPILSREAWSPAAVRWYSNPRRPLAVPDASIDFRALRAQVAAGRALSPFDSLIFAGGVL